MPYEKKLKTDSLLSNVSLLIISQYLKNEIKSTKKF